MKQEFNDISLKEFNSFGVEQRASKLITFESAQELCEVFEQDPPQRWMALGGGNNILFTQEYDGVLLKHIGQSISIIAEDNTSATIKVDAGVEWDDLVAWAVDHNLWGIENLSLIPGKCGAAPVQNIGAYGVEAGDVIVQVEMFNPANLNTLILSGEHCQFGYRESVFKHSLKGRVIITSITIRLSKIANPKLGYGDVIKEVAERGEPTLKNIREAICAIRNSKLPDTKVLGNAGSFFKNPIVEYEKAEKLLDKYPEMPYYPIVDQPLQVKIAAGWLIDKAGLKGYTDGTVGVHQKQALVLINLSGATGGEVLALARKVQQSVKEQFGVEIDTEVNII